MNFISIKNVIHANHLKSSVCMNCFESHDEELNGQCAPGVREPNRFAPGMPLASLVNLNKFH